MKKPLIGSAIILLVIVVAGGGYLWYSFTEPIYNPGMVASGESLRAPLVPPAQLGADNFWQVEDDIDIHHFAVGTGRNVLIVHGGPGVPYTEPWPGLDPLTDTHQFHYYDQRGSGQSTRPFDTFFRQLL